MSRPPVADQGERDRLVTELERTFFVEAGAGTGKTAAVVAAIVARVAAGRLAMERLVAITFTIAAAGELRVRIREELEAAAAGAAAAGGAAPARPGRVGGGPRPHRDHPRLLLGAPPDASAGGRAASGLRDPGRPRQ